MTTMLLCALFVVAFATGQEQDIFILRTHTGEMSDRELIEKLVKSVNHLETERMKQQERINALEDTVLKQHEVIADLQKTLDNLVQTKDATPVKAGVSGGAEQVILNNKFLHKRYVNQPRTDQRNRNVVRQLPISTVAFSAVVGNHHLLHLGARQNLVFDVANVNTNNVYNVTDGVFTVPVPGVYVVTSSVMAYYNREVACYITVNGVASARIYARGSDHRLDQGSQTILLHLKLGDDVSVQNFAADDAVYGSMYTSFSGFLLYEEGPLAIVG